MVVLCFTYLIMITILLKYFDVCIHQTLAKGKNRSQNKTKKLNNYNPNSLNFLNVKQGKYLFLSMTEE